MRYLCTNCSYIYDEALWDIEDWYDPWVKLDDMQDYFLCPMCWERAWFFQEIKEEVIYFDNLDDLTNIEYLHYPVVAQIDWKIKVSVGREEFHPSVEDHFITSISLFDEYGDIIEERFLSFNDWWEAIFDNYDLDEFEIQIRCNLHWVWGIKKIKSI
jgi:desulfoferrodoxin (superoxide reductase-like protein)